MSTTTKRPPVLSRDEALQNRFDISFDLDNSWLPNDGRIYEHFCPYCKGNVIIMGTWPRFCPYCAGEWERLGPTDGTCDQEYLHGAGYLVDDSHLKSKDPKFIGIPAAAVEDGECPRCHEAFYVKPKEGPPPDSGMMPKPPEGANFDSDGTWDLAAAAPVSTFAATCPVCRGCLETLRLKPRHCAWCGASLADVEISECVETPAVSA